MDKAATVGYLMKLGVFVFVFIISLEIINFNLVGSS